MLGLSIPDVAYRNTSSLATRVNALFRAGEQGVWYDPSDRTTLYQDAAGTTPVTAMEQPVGLILDKSKGLVLGAELFPNGTFDADVSGWTAHYAGAVTWQSGEVRITNITGGTPGEAYHAVTLSAGKTYFFSVNITAINFVDAQFVLSETNSYLSGILAGSVTNHTTGTKSFFYTPSKTGTYYLCIAHRGNSAVGNYAQFDNISVRELPGNHAYQTTSASRPVLSARVNQYLNTATLATQNVTTLATTYTLRFDGTGSITLSGTATGTYTAGAHSVVCTAGTLTSTVTGTVTNADLRPTNSGVNLPPYQRVGASTDYDTAGFPHYLKFDGIDDSLVTNSIDFTSTDKMTVCAGVRKLSDAAVGVVAELSANWNLNEGTFTLQAPPTDASSRYYFGSKGTAQSAATILSGYAAPITNVFSGIGDIFAPNAALRVNGTQVAQSTATQGTGNYGNYPLYIGRRNGASLPFKGHIYSLIVRGAQSSDAQIASVERYVNGKTKAWG